MFLRDPGSSPFDDLCYDCDDLDVTIFCQLEVVSLPLRSFDLGRFTILALGWNTSRVSKLKNDIEGVRI